MELTLHPTPSAGDVVREQIRNVGLALRREAVVAAAVLVLVTLAIVYQHISADMRMQFGSDSPFGTGIIAFLFPFAVWRRENRFGPAFLWTLPVDRRTLALTKVFAGWVWMTSALAAFVIWDLSLSLLAGTTSVGTVAISWFIRFPGSTAMYLFGSALVLGLRHPLRWLLGAAGLFFLSRNLMEPLVLDTVLNSVGFSESKGPEGILGAMESLAQWATFPFLPLGAGLAALWAAASRHAERR